jgi:hypothetical protein
MRGLSSWFIDLQTKVQGHTTAGGSHRGWASETATTRNRTHSTLCQLVFFMIKVMKLDQFTLLWTQNWGCPADLLTNQTVLDPKAHCHTLRAQHVGIEPTSPLTKVVALPTKPQIPHTNNKVMQNHWNKDIKTISFHSASQQEATTQFTIKGRCFLTLGWEQHPRPYNTAINTWR